MKKILIVLIPLLLFSCRQYSVTVVNDNQREKIDEILKQVTVSGYDSRLKEFSNPRHTITAPEELIRVEEYIIGQLLEFGYEVSETKLEKDWTYLVDEEGYYSVERTPVSMRNIIATKPGKDPSLKPVLIGAHHDTVSIAPGTNDNGTGCAGVLEAAYQLRDVELERTVTFAFFAFEEDGLEGARDYVSTLSESEYPDSVIILETIGFTSETQDVVAGADVLLNMPKTGDFVGAFGSTQSKELLMDFIHSTQKDVDNLPVYGICVDDNFGSNPLLRDLLRSDHAPFWPIGVPALMVTDTANLRVGNFYHTKYDNYDNVDREFATKVVKAAISTICKRAGI